MNPAEMQILNEQVWTGARSSVCVQGDVDAASP